MRFHQVATLFVAVSCVFIQSCSFIHSAAQDSDKKVSENQVYIPHQKYELDNGLTVILHEDHSDPLVHVDVTYHVGSAREELGKSGFAHFFEHMMFQGSQNVADEQHFKIITESGGNLNGSTNTDRTNYYQTVPANQLEKVLWMEADRMGYLLPAVTQEKFEIQRDTVKNERSERVDNKPYGLRHERNGEALYPQNHPYSWSTIGYVEDLDRVTVEDLKAFFHRWYGPNNAVLTIGGDIDVEKTRLWIEKYFGPIKKGPSVESPEKAMVSLPENRFVTLEDNIHLPLLQITYPTVYARHADEAPLDVLADILGGGKTSLFYKNLVKSGDAVQAIVSHPCRELACELQLLVLANPEKVSNLDVLYDKVEQTLKEFVARGVLEDDLTRTKASIEASTVYGLQSVSGKVSTLASNQTYYSEPDLVAEDLERYSSVTKADVLRVFEQYVESKPSVIMSVVPHGQDSIAVAPANIEPPVRKFNIDTVADVSDELIAQAQDDFDRSVMPVAGKPPTVKVPDFWQGEIAPGIKILGVTSDETPTVSLTITMDGGSLVEPMNKAGVASLTAAMMNESTQLRSSESMANELAKLGSSVYFTSGGRYNQIHVSSLSKHLDKTLSLLAEKLYRPAFLESELEQLRERYIQGLIQDQKNPSVMATRARDQILFGKDNRISLPDEGTLDSLADITLQDVKSYYETYYSAAKANAVIVSNLTQKDVAMALGFLSDWNVADYKIPGYQPFPEFAGMKVYLVDNPGAAQSVVSIFRRDVPYDAEGKHFYSRLMNFPLGGTFNSRINLKLREDKGYTYGASSAFVGGKTIGWFETGGDIKQEYTADAIREFIAEITSFKKSGMTDRELLFMRNAYTLNDALEYETPSSKAAFLRHLNTYKLDKGYKKRQTSIIQNVSLEELNQLAFNELDISKMQIVVVGDKQVLQEQLATLNLPIVDFTL